jgi:hypothetical protein
MTDDEQRVGCRHGQVADLDKKLKVQTEAEDLLAGRSGGTVVPVAGTGPRLIDDAGNVIRALTKTDKLIDTLPPRARRLDEGPPSMGRVLRGAILGDWTRATRIERAMGEACWRKAAFPCRAN